MESGYASTCYRYRHFSLCLPVVTLYMVRNESVCPAIQVDTSRTRHFHPLARRLAIQTYLPLGPSLFLPACSTDDFPRIGSTSVDLPCSVFIVGTGDLESHSDLILRRALYMDTQHRTCERILVGRASSGEHGQCGPLGSSRDSIDACCSTPFAAASTYACLDGAPPTRGCGSYICL